MKVVLDTNVLISGIFFHGPPSVILKAWRGGNIQFVLSPGIIDEYVRVAMILADEFPAIEFSPLLTLIIAHSEVIQAAPLAHQVCEDAADDKFLACALASESKAIISGDKHLLKISGYQGITILTPHAFVEQYIKKQP